VTRSRPFVGSLAFRLLLLASVPYVALAVLAVERISAQRHQMQHAEALVAEIDIRRAVVRVYGPKHVERMTMEGIARIDELGYPRPLVVAATGIDFESIGRENHTAFEDAIDSLQARYGGVVMRDGTTLGQRLVELRANIETLRADLRLRVTDPKAVDAAFDQLDVLLSEVLDVESTVGSHGDDPSITGESDEHERLRALASVLDSAGGRGNELLSGILYEDNDRIFEVVVANGRHAALSDNYRGLLTDVEAADFDAVRMQLELLPPSSLERISEFDMLSFESDLITMAVDALNNHRSYLVALDGYSEDMHAQMGRRAEESAHRADRQLRDTWLLLFGVGGVTALMIILGTAATLLPLRRLTRRAEAISAGNIVVEPLPVRGSNDIRSLTRTTNEMTALLGEVEHEIHRLAGGDFDAEHEVDLPGTIGASIQGSMNRLHDITRQLQRSEQLASAIVAGAGDAIWTIDANDIVLTANDASARLTGVAADEQPGLPIDRFLTATAGAAVMRSAAGEEWSVLVSASTIDTDGEPVRVVIAHDISDRLDFEQQLALQARRDPLTGLPNRLAVIERIRELTLAEARAAVLYVDLDGFKSVNDLRGHSMGDEVLAEVGRRLKANVSSDDLVGRLGGDEFIVVSTTLLEERDIADLGSRLIGTIEQPFTSEDLINLSASIGVVMLDGHIDAETVLSEADSALYQAKHRGKRRLEVFDRELQAAVAHQTELELALRRAIPNGELVLHLQPIVDLRTNRIDGAEALVRWDRPGHGLVAPNDFIPIAERSSLIIELDRWVIERCCERIAQWRHSTPGADLRLAVNISGRHLMEGNLVADVAAALARTRADASMLEIELTETHLLGDLERAVASLTALRERGVRVSIDDFGTGYSAMNYLRRLPIDAIKIDRSFVVAATGSATDASVVDAVIAIGRAHGLEVIAEGIETIDQLEFVRQRGCSRAQGYLIARPMAADEAEQLLLDRAPAL
jgi:diguanylate cyclase (GGDEF)-like protein